MGKSNMKKMIVGGLAAVAAAAIGIALFPRRLPPRRSGSAELPGGAVGLLGTYPEAGDL
jgi:hypothetical protein